MSLRQGASALAVALTITGASAVPASAHFFTTNYQPYVAPSLAHRQGVEAGLTVIRGHKHATRGSQQQVAGGVGKRDGLPTGQS
jgi:hypothetical protein